MRFFIFFVVLLLVCLFRVGWKWHDGMTSVPSDALIISIIVDIALFIWAAVLLFMQVKAGL